MQATIPTTNQFRTVGRYMQQVDPTHTAELKAEFDDLRTQVDLGRYYFECDPAGFERALEIAR